MSGESGLWPFRVSLEAACETQPHTIVREATPGAKLIVTEGPGAERSFDLDGSEWMIGRSRSCEIPLPDPSISRRHLLIRRKGGVFVAIDQGSENGTLVEGASIAELVLSNGHELVLGDTTLRFVAAADGTMGESETKTRETAMEEGGPTRLLAGPTPSSGTQSSPSSMRRRKGPRLAVGAAALLTIVGVAAIGIGIGGRRASAPPPVVSPGGEGEAFAAFQRGLGLVRDGDWDEAASLFAEARTLDPDNAELERYAERAQKEAAEQVRAADVRMQLEQGDSDRAEAVFAQIDPESLVFEREGGSLRAAIDALRAVAGEPLDEAERQGAPIDRESTRFAATGSSRAGAGRLAAIEREATGRGIALPNQNGRASGASSRETRRAAVRNPSAGPTEALGSARSAGGDDVARRHFEAGLRALEGGNLERAAEHLGESLRLDPGNAAAKAAMDKLRGRAEGLFREAYAERNTDPAGARRKLAVVVRLSRPGEALYEKATSWLAKLEGPR
ncbi:FHA domain-containing protein [Vulgatibacter incomptus]|uniref:FHA domain containing protein n=1 Tax=Vulgatibacter incomptus TaxID=1391653 RepID=A0A0K1PAS1_9BACT|nr:FHA domain-containing protein [Vulgatibacter incomptus]AKU90638.1 FHA domain containing protein [Vulgatibacter incomptus]